jgi:UDP-GlcNAc:undecaprenyl-phosphate GlcNAc-1-phosphate transferase
MGDAGSQVLGFAVGVLSLRATQAGNSAVSAAIPVLLLALPILDTLSVMVQRVSEGRSPFSADRNHIHHKLLQLGFDHHEAVMVIYAVQADLFLLVYWLRYESDLVIFALVAGLFIVSVTVLQGAARRGWRFRSANESERRSALRQLLAVLREPRHLPRWSYFAVAMAVAVYASVILAETVTLSSDVNLLVLSLLGVSIVLLAILQIKPLNIIEKGALYTTAAVLVYLDSVLPPDQRSFNDLKWAAVAVAAAGTILRLRLSPDRRFVLTPLDLIVLFAALVVPSLPGVFTIPVGGALGIAKLIILFYAIEVLVSRVELGVVWLRIAVTSLLTGLMLRPLLPI